jgi:hypothetical protein
LAFLYIIIFIKCKPLSKNVLDYLEQDEETFKDYRNHFQFLSCKLMTYSKMKYLYENEMIDQYVNKTKRKGEFVDLLRERIMDYCAKIYKGNNMVNLLLI